MRQVLNYNIHDILKFQIIRDRKFDFWDLIKLRYDNETLRRINRLVCKC